MPPPTDFKRLVVPEVVRPYVGFRGVIVLVLAVVVALWLRQNIAPTPKATMMVIPEQRLRAVDLPARYVLPAEAPSPTPHITPDLSAEEIQRRIEAQAAQPAVEAAYDGPGTPEDEPSVPHMNSVEGEVP